MLRSLPACRRVSAVTSVVASAVLAAVLIALPAAPAQAAGAAPLPDRKVTAWVPNWDQPRAMRSFTQNADLFAAASPFWYEMTPQGGIGRYWGAEDGAVLSGIRAAGVPLIPTITNAFDAARTSAVLGSDTARAAHVRAIVDLVLAKSYDGIDIDYESMAAADRQLFSTFVRELSTSLRAHGKLLTVVVHPKTSEPGTWSGPQAQDYAAIGAVADRVRVMAYDYSWSTSPAGPIAPLSWVRSVAAFAASRIPAAKVELGMNLYGYDWVGSKGEGVTHDVVTSRMSAAGATRTWDPVAAEPSFSYVTNGVSHQVHYADAQSVAARLAVVDEHGLAGAAFWRLGGEDPAVWGAVRSRWGAPAAPAPQPVADTVAPAVPRAVVARGGKRSIGLAWAASTDTGGSGDVRYRVLRATSAGGSWTTLATVAGTRFVDRGVARGRTYWYALRAVDGAGNVSATSAVVSAAGR